jgi:hypothetical protein
MLWEWALGWLALGEIPVAVIPPPPVSGAIDWRYFIRQRQYVTEEEELVVLWRQMVNYPVESQ